MDLKQKTKIK